MAFDIISPLRGSCIRDNIYYKDLTATPPFLSNVVAKSLQKKQITIWKSNVVATSFCFIFLA